MKKISILLTCMAVATGLSAVTAYADLGDQPWDELNRLDESYKIDIRWPKAGNYAVKDLCVAGDQLKTLTAVDVCVEWKDVTRRGNLYDGVRYECVRKEHRVDTVARNFTRRECVDLFYPRPGPRYDGPICRRYEDVAYTYPASFDVEIYSFAFHYREAQRLAVKRFDLPNFQ